MFQNPSLDLRVLFGHSPGKEAELADVSLNASVVPIGWEESKQLVDGVG